MCVLVVARDGDSFGRDHIGEGEELECETAVRSADASLYLAGVCCGFVYGLPTKTAQFVLQNTLFASLKIKINVWVVWGGSLYFPPGQ